MSDSPIISAPNPHWGSDGTDISPQNTGVVKGVWSNNGVKNIASQTVVLLQSEYDALTPDTNTLYFIIADPV